LKRKYGKNSLLLVVKTNPALRTIFSYVMCRLQRQE